MRLLLPSEPPAYGDLPDPSTCGWLLTVRNPHAPGAHLAPYVWAVDNERYALGDRFDFDRYLSLLERVRVYPGRCAFAVVPDVVGDAAATSQDWDRYAGLMRPTGLPLAFVAQDGLEALPDVAFDALFIGGTTDYKLSATARRLITEAHRAGKWVHVGRVNTRRRIRWAFGVGADSIDGTAWAIAPRVNLRWAAPLLWSMNRQGRLL